MSEPPPTPPKRPWTFLGRLARAIREQNWFAVVLELVIVILGVVVGFQVTAWDAERDRRELEAVQLDALRDELVRNRVFLKYTIISQEAVVTSQRELLRIVHGAAPRPTPDSLLKLLGMSYVFYRYRPELPAYDAMVSSGDLRLIRDPELRTMIVRFAEEVRQPSDEEDQLTAARDRYLAYLSRNGDLLATLNPIWREGFEFPPSGWEVDPQSLLSAPEFGNHVFMLGLMEASILMQFESAQRRLDTVLVALDVDLDSLNAR